MWVFLSGIQVNIHVKMKCERSEPEKFEIELSRANSYNVMRAKRAGKNLKIVSRAKRAKTFLKTLHFSPNSSKFRSDYLFSFQNKTDYLFPVFLRSEYLFPKSARPPSESNGRPLNHFKLKMHMLKSDQQCCKITRLSGKQWVVVSFPTVG